MASQTSNCINIESSLLQAYLVSAFVELTSVFNHELMGTPSLITAKP